MIYRIVYNEISKKYKIQEKPWKWFPFWMKSSSHPWVMIDLETAEKRINQWKIAANKDWVQVGDIK